ncbi:MAG: TAXI family TRAP transporter solute-binding subunit [Thermodesulfobacteriota bacterium]|nr:TAXI family TRAP transporter solute-binding subunit [Thermodesulfobacteriota bacterium]
MVRQYRWIAGVIFLCFIALLVPPLWAAETLPNLPPSMFWTAYDVGSTGYVQTATVADGLMKKYKVKIRVIPSGTSIGRFMPLLTGSATYANMGDESAFYIEGLYECNAMGLGPQPLRQVIAPHFVTIMAVTRESGITTPDTLKGKRVAWVVGASTLNVKAVSTLAFANLTFADVLKVEFPSYAASLKGLIEGKVDAAIAGHDAPLLYELGTSPRGCAHVIYPHADKKGWASMQAITPWLGPVLWDDGPSFKKGKPDEVWSYRYPNMVTFEKTSAKEVYALVKAIHEAYPLYKDGHKAMPHWRLEKAGVPPANCPFHEGAIKFFKEIGIWKPEHDQWNQKLIEHMREVKKEWDAVETEATEKGIKEKDFSKLWIEKRKAKGWMIEY